jgi:hypothetical protein
MDFTKFAEEEFNAKEWVNAALRAKKDVQTPLDVSQFNILRCFCLESRDDRGNSSFSLFLV